MSIDEGTKEVLAVADFSRSPPVWYIDRADAKLRGRAFYLHIVLIQREDPACKGGGIFRCCTHGPWP